MSLAGLITKVEVLAPKGSLTPEQWSRLWRSLKRSDDLRARSKAYGKSTPLQLGGFVGLGLTQAVAGRMLNHACLMSIPWAIAAIWLRARRRSGLRGVGPRPIVLGFLALVAAFPKTFVHIDPNYAGPVAKFWVHLGVGLSITIPIIAILGAILRSRVLPEIGRADTVFARLKSSSAFAMKILFALYVVAVLLSIPVAIKANRQLDARIADEPALIWQMKP
jgi:hypothetical protein